MSKLTFWLERFSIKKSIDFDTYFFATVYFHFTSIVWCHWFDRRVLPDDLTIYFEWTFWIKSGELKGDILGLGKVWQNLKNYVCGTCIGLFSYLGISIFGKISWTIISLNVSTKHYVYTCIHEPTSSFMYNVAEIIFDDLFNHTLS